jgi:hypothetical protein
MWPKSTFICMCMYQYTYIHIYIPGNSLQPVTLVPHIHCVFNIWHRSHPTIITLAQIKPLHNTLITKFTHSLLALHSPPRATHTHTHTHVMSVRNKTCVISIPSTQPYETFTSLCQASLLAHTVFKTVLFYEPTVTMYFCRISI